MSIIKIPVRFVGLHEEKILYALFYCGSTFSCINPDYPEAIGHLEKMLQPTEVATASHSHFQ